MKINNITRELLADQQHDIWSDWMRYMFSMGHYRILELNGEPQQVWIMPSSSLDRWTRQMNTHYNYLTEQEKNSDREQADKIIALLESSTKI